MVGLQRVGIGVGGGGEGPEEENRGGGGGEELRGGWLSVLGVGESGGAEYDALRWEVVGWRLPYRSLKRSHRKSEEDSEGFSGMLHCMESTSPMHHHSHQRFPYRLDQSLWLTRAFCVSASAILC